MPAGAVSPWIVTGVAHPHQIIQVKATAVYHLNVIFGNTIFEIFRSYAHFTGYFTFTWDRMILLEGNPSLCSAVVFSRSSTSCQRISGITGHFVPEIPLILKIIEIAFICRDLVIHSAVLLVQVFEIAA